MIRTRKSWVLAMAVMGLATGLMGTVRADDTTMAPGKATVTVTVTTAKDEPAVGAKVMIVAAPVEMPNHEATDADQKDPSTIKKPKMKAVAEGVTDDKGVIALPDVPAGDYIVNAVLKGEGVGMAKLHLEAGKDEAVAIKLKMKKMKKPKKAPASEPSEAAPSN